MEENKQVVFFLVKMEKKNNCKLYSFSLYFGLIYSSNETLRNLYGVDRKNSIVP